jgi:hypothetical protein
MICFAKPVLIDDLDIVQREDSSVTCYMCYVYTSRKAKHIHETIRFSSQRMLHKDCDNKGSVEETISGCESQGTLCHEELIGCKHSVLKQF